MKRDTEPADALYPVIAPRFQVMSHWRGVSDPLRSPMTRLYSFLVIVGLWAGCSTHPRQSEQTAPPPPQSQRTSHSFSVGMTREQVRAELTDSWLLVSASRPTTGWSSQVSPPAGARAAMFERSHSGAVEACDVYWLGHTNAPRMYYGKWLNYFYFDRDQKLIGFDRWVID